MDYKQFEDLEQDRFLNQHYGYDNMRQILTNLQPIDHPIVKDETKRGIKEGVEDFLKSNGNPDSLYLSDLSAFCFDDSTYKRVAQQLNDLHPNLNCVEAFAEDVCETYRMFVYNESYSRLQQEVNS
ncbi:MAG: hypothetical protein IH934_04975 [Nanoarchaeota archaeon]|nr:hypothetical protein [Nanoarchaeota archaeon]